MRSSWRSPRWFETSTGRVLFLHQLAGVDTVRKVKDSRHPGGFSLDLTLNPPGIAPRRVSITFSRVNPGEPRVTVDGPIESPHRYSDGTLCMWYPYDPPERRWKLADGAAALVVNIAAHLVREEWYRLTGEWPGAEILHSSPNTANDPLPRRTRSRAPNGEAAA